MRCSPPRGLGALLLTLLSTGSALAQAGTGVLTGVVTDGATGKPVAGVVVLATSPTAPGAKAVVTGADGAFTFDRLRAGRYQLSTTMEGYKPEARDDLTLGAGVTLRATLAIIPEAVHLEEVVVTGSRIRRKDLSTPAPVTVITREQILASGKLLVADFIQALPEQVNAPNANYNFQGDGAVRASLRGLGDNRTLVLLNGRRCVAGGNGANQSVDLGALPSAAVERIEILKDGASPIYGSEAIGGVVNVITRRSWIGTEVAAYTGTSSRGDGTTYAIDLTTGQAGEAGSLMLSVGYGATKPVWSGDRTWSESFWAYDFNGKNSPLGTVGPYAVGSSIAPAGRAFVWRAQGRLTALGNRTFTQNVDSLRVLGGFDGSLPRWAGPLEGWRWEVNGNFGRTMAMEAWAGMARKSALKAALGPSYNYGTATTPDWGCGTADIRIEGCVPVSIFDAAGMLSPEQIAAVTFDGTARGSNQLASVLATASGELFRLWSARPVGLAAGLEYRTISGTQIPDATAASGDAATAGTVYKTSGSQDVREAFLELSLPFLESVRFAEALEVQLATRIFRYSGFGTDWTWKVGARWKPIQDVTLRGTFSTAFRAPSIWELYYGAASSKGITRDPCAGVDDAGNPKAISPWCGAAAGPSGNGNGQQSPLVTWQDQGNPALRPELAKVFTAGVVVEPRFLPGLSVTVDAYGVAIDNVIQYSGMDPIGSCYPMQADVTPQYCNQIQRDPVTQALTAVRMTPINAGSERMTGIDVSVRYGFPTAVGRFDLAWDGTWLERYDLVLGDGTTIHARDNFDVPRGLGWAMPTLRFNAAAGWRREGLGAGVGVRYLGPLKECFATDGVSFAFCSYEHSYERRVSEYAAWNAQVGYGFSSAAGRTDLQLGVQNLLDTRPPTIYGAKWFASDPGYDFVGRYFYLRLSHRL